MQRVMQKIDEGFIVQPYLMFAVGDTSRGDVLKAYSSCMNSFVISTSSIQRFMALPRPRDTDDRFLFFWGVMQAIVNQQNAVTGLQKLIVEESERVNFTATYPTWKTLRDLRDAASGHPTKPAYRNVVGIIAVGSEDWGLSVQFRGGSIEARSFVMRQLPIYENELLAALRPIEDGMQHLVEALDFDGSRGSRR